MEKGRDQYSVIRDPLSVIRRPTSDHGSRITDYGSSILALILILFILLGLTYAFVTPIFEASDELWHYPMVRHLAQGNPLPVQDPDNVGPWKQQASQPPLYYYVAAALTFWIDTSDIDRARWLNPHVDNGVITEDGNINLVIHDPALNPWQGTLLTVHIIRIFSVLLGATTVYLTYQIAREVAPDRPEIALGAAAVNAFTPMFLFISGAVNNDNLVIPLVSLALLMMIRVVTRKEGAPTRGRLLLLGAIIGLAALAKYPGLALMPMALGTLFIAHWQGMGGKGQEAGDLWRVVVRTVRDWLIVAVPFAAIAGWWYWRNKQLYGDWLGWSAFFEVLGVRQTPASLAQLWDERWGFMASFWGLFGGVNVPMPGWIYALLNGIVVVAVVGFVVYLFRILSSLRSGVESGYLPVRRYGLGIANRGLPVTDYRIMSTSYRSLLAGLLNLVTTHFALIVCLIWSAATVIGLMRWATFTWSSQGRLVFAAISTLDTLLVVGLVGWLPQSRVGRLASHWVVAALGGFLLLVAALAPFLWIQPAYQPRSYQAPGDLGSERPVNAIFSEKMRLVSYRLDPENTIRPGEAIDLVLEWEVLEEMDRDWSVFVHLNDPVLNAPIAQRDMYPQQGLVATRLLEPGERFEDTIHLTLPATAVAPASLELVVGLYDLQTGERMRLANGRDVARLRTVTLEAVPGEVPNSMSAKFENALELTGFTLEPRRAQPGETMTLVLHWRAQEDLEVDYTFFAQVIDTETNRWASSDLAPPDGTANWVPGTVKTLTMPLTVREDAPPGVYPLIVGVYTRTADGGFDRLQLLTSEGRLTDDFLPLTRVRIE